MRTKVLLQSIELDFNATKLGSSVNFAKLIGQEAYYRPIFHNIVWANSIRIGLAQPFCQQLCTPERGVLYRRRQHLARLSAGWRRPAATGPGVQLGIFHRLFLHPGAERGK